MVSELGSGANFSQTNVRESESLSSSMSKFTPISFNNSMTIRLSNTNFLVWRKQVLSAIRGHKLQDFLLESKTPPKKFLSAEEESLGTINQEFLDWEQQDQLLVSWLLSGMSESVVSRMVNCETSAQVWSTLEIYFSSQIRAKVSQYETQLKNTRKESLSMNDFLLKVRSIVDHLGLVGQKLTVKEHVSAIFNGLDEEYENFIMNFDMRDKLESVEEVESLLLCQEARLEKKHLRLQEHTQGQISANFAGANTQSDKRRFSKNSQQGSGFGYSGQGRSFGQSGGGRGRSLNGRGRSGGGRGQWNNNKPQCQLCGKFGHVVLQCYYRFDQSFFGPSQLGNQPNQSQFSPHSSNSPSFNGAGRGQGSVNLAALTVSPSAVCDTNWYPDSGATNHLTADSSNVMEKAEYFGPEQVHMGNGSVVQNSATGGEAF